MKFTATAFILKEDKVLLIWHHKLQKWMPPGGKMEEGETPAQCAVREAHEETGLEVSLISQANFSTKHPGVDPIPLPYMMQLEDAIVEPHRHTDFIYLAEPVGGKLLDGRWFSADEIAELEDILPDVREIALHLQAVELSV